VPQINTPYNVGSVSDITRSDIGVIRLRSKLVPKLSHKNQLFLCRKAFQFGDFLCDHG